MMSGKYVYLVKKIFKKDIKIQGYHYFIQQLEIFILSSFDFDMRINIIGASSNHDHIVLLLLHNK